MLKTDTPLLVFSTRNSALYLLALQGPKCSWPGWPAIGQTKKGTPSEYPFPDMFFTSVLPRRLPGSAIKTRTLGNLLLTSFCMACYIFVPASSLLLWVFIRCVPAPGCPPAGNIYGSACIRGRVNAQAASGKYADRIKLWILNCK